MITLIDTVVANPDLMMADLEGEAVLLNIHSGSYFGLNEVGTSIWLLIDEPCSVSRVIDGLLRHYDAPFEVLRNDVIAFLEDMQARGLVCVTSEVNA